MSAGRLAIDIGGTFTDVAIVKDGVLQTTKVPTDATAPSRAVATALDRIGDDSIWDVVLHGTTVATNALLERKTPPIAFLTTVGFRDVLQIRRLKRENLYSIGWDPLEPLVPRDRIFEVDERTAADGSIVSTLTGAELERICDWVETQEVESIAICLLHAWINPEHEEAIVAALTQRFPTLHVTASHQVSPVIGEYERSSTTVVHAALKPTLSAYLSDIEAALAARGSGGRLFVVQSNGGLATFRQIVAEPARAVESGPAAGALHAGDLAAEVGVPKAISFDMGGTTAKACLLEDGSPTESTELRVGDSMHVGQGFREQGGYVVRGRAIDLAEVGAGGGSLCRLDEGGVLRVGPESAGARPGPVAYGRGGEIPTVTDADLVLGVLEAGARPSGVHLDVERATDAIRIHIADPLGLSVEEAAWLIVEVANSNMMRAIEAVSSEHGRDPAQYTLIAFGGAGPAHATAIAQHLGMTEVIVPPTADSFSAVGLHRCRVRRDVHRPLLRPLTDLTWVELDALFAELESEIRADLASDGLSEANFGRFVDARLEGQRSELTLEVDLDLLDGGLETALAGAFATKYVAEYGHVVEDARIEIVSAHVRGEVGMGMGDVRFATEQGLASSTARVYLGPATGWVNCDRVTSADIGPDKRSGPLLLQVGQATAVVPPEGTVRIDEYGNARIELAPAGQQRSLNRGWEGRAGLELFRNGLGSIVDRMAFTLARTAYSTMASDAHDFSIAVCDRNGAVSFQGVGVLIHLGSVSSAMDALAKRGMLPLSEGDVVMLNDPYDGGTHLPDFIVVAPVYVHDELVAYTVAISHMIDIGGLVAGSFMTGAKELLQEGLVIPPVKLYAAGAPNSAVTDIIRRNVRQPDEVLGDLFGLVASVKLGAERLVELGNSMGASRLIAEMAELIQYGAERGRRELRRLGTASATFVDYLDDDGVTDEPVEIVVTLRTNDGLVSADFSGSSEQVKSGINATMSTTRSIVQWCVRTRMSEDFPDNAGFYSLLNVEAPLGTVVNATNDAPVANRGLLAFRIVDAVFGAMAQMFPGEIWAAYDGSLDPLTIGAHRDDGSRFTVVDIVGGTTGARPWADGVEGVAPPVGNARNNSVEVLESSAPVRVVHYRLEPGTGGAGRFRGGNAVSRAYEILCDEAEVYVRSDRRRFQPWGLEGGLPGAASQNLLVGLDGVAVELPSKHVFTMRRGEQLIRRGAGGGGFGDPSERDPSAVERDLREERVLPR